MDVLFALVLGEPLVLEPQEVYDHPLRKENHMETEKQEKNTLVEIQLNIKAHFVPGTLFHGVD